jgi:hypothetical protein
VISESRARLIERARELTAALQRYEARHPGRGPDQNGRAYDPWKDVVHDPFEADAATGPIDEVRTAAIDERTWEGFAWASSRFVVSNERGEYAIVGFNEDAGRWFVDDNTPVALPDEFVDGLMAEYEAVTPLAGFEEPRTVHQSVVAAFGRTKGTIPTIEEVSAYLERRRHGRVGTAP